MSKPPAPPALLDANRLAITTNRSGFIEELTITDPYGWQLGSARETGSKMLLFINTMSDSFLFPCRPYEVRDRDGNPALRIERSGVFRRHVLTVRRPDRSMIGRLVGKTWANAFRHTGYCLELADERIGELVFEKPGYRIVDSSGTELGRTTRLSEEATTVRTTLIRTDVSDSLASLALAATIVRHIGG